MQEILLRFFFFLNAVRLKQEPISASGLRNCFTIKKQKLTEFCLAPQIQDFISSFCISNVS